MWVFSSLYKNYQTVLENNMGGGKVSTGTQPVSGKTNIPWIQIFLRAPWTGSHRGPSHKYLTSSCHAGLN